MRVAQEKVREFHDKHGFATPEKPALISGPAADVRYKVMREELEEYMRAQDRGDLVEVADGIVDLLYTVLGTAVVHGIDVQPIFDEVHRSNMTKDAAPAHEPNRPVKGPRFERPRIADLLLIQSTGLRDAEYDMQTFKAPDDCYSQDSGLRPLTRHERHQLAADHGFDTWEDYRGGR